MAALGGGQSLPIQLRKGRWLWEWQLGALTLLLKGRTAGQPLSHCFSLLLAHCICQVSFLKYAGVTWTSFSSHLFSPLGVRMTWAIRKVWAGFWMISLLPSVLCIANPFITTEGGEPFKELFKKIARDSNLLNLFEEFLHTLRKTQFMKLIHLNDTYRAHFGVCVCKSSLWSLPMTFWITWELFILYGLPSSPLHSPFSVLNLTPRANMEISVTALHQSFLTSYLFSISLHHVFINTFSISLHSGSWRLTLCFCILNFSFLFYVVVKPDALFLLQLSYQLICTVSFQWSKYRPWLYSESAVSSPSPCKVKVLTKSFLMTKVMIVD